MIKTKKYIAILLIIFPILVSADLLEYKGKAIHPKCLEKLSDLPHTKRILKNIKHLGNLFTPQKIDSFLSLESCLKFKSSFTTDKDGFHIYSDTKSTSFRQPMTQYRSLLKLNDKQVLVEYMWNGGGSGYFSGFQILKRFPKKLKLIGNLPIAGDRCNGGFYVEKVSQDYVEVTRNLTPIAIIELTNMGKKLKMAAYKDLEASAASCFAKEKILITKTAKGVKTTSQGITIAKLGITELTKTKWNQRYKYQLCFSQILDKTAESFATRFIPYARLNEFIQSFKKKCMPKK
jgi:hypothetical protein